MTEIEYLDKKLKKQQEAIQFLAEKLAKLIAQESLDSGIIKSQDEFINNQSDFIGLVRGMMID